MMRANLLSFYLYCPRKLFLERAKRSAEPSPVAGTMRRLWQQAHEKINSADESIVKGFSNIPTAKEVEDTYSRHYSGLLKQTLVENSAQLKKSGLDPARTERSMQNVIMAEARHRAGNVSAFLSSNDVHGDELWQGLSPKTRAGYRISSEKLQLSCTVDELEIYENRLVPIKLIAGRAPKEGTWPGHQLQIAAYAVLLEERFSTTINKGIARYIDKDIERDVVMNPFLREKVTDTRDKVLKLLEEDKLPPLITNENKCRACSIADRCRDELPDA